ncbi:DUF4307 domain-containing protein [Nocardioides sp.]|uniref:DUF4307 domain-containing protein n=1 Tax=Nocardioides sp. TaxID=35761 RepID=UPI0026100967|nr:DUF4307 domain-containing protein [Nocardioides sp.]
MSDQSRVSARYAANPSPWSKVFAVIGVVIFVALAIWLVWVIAVKSNPAVTSKLTTWKVVDSHSVSATVEVKLKDGAENPRCVLRATAEDHTTVGEFAFVPVNGVNAVSVRTERTATTLESVGCTAKGQNDAR